MIDIKLGQLIVGPALRDAIHIAVCPMTSKETLLPGCHVGVSTGTAIGIGPKVGIVDPFLTAPVEPGQTFWLLLYPQTITGLRHEWSHPAFPSEAKPNFSPSEQWLRKFAEESLISYGTLMDGAAQWVAYEDYLCLGGLLEGKYVPDDFWIHYQNVTGKTVPETKQGNFFTCSC